MFKSLIVVPKQNVEYTGREEVTANTPITLSVQEGAGDTVLHLLLNPGTLSVDCSIAKPLATMTKLPYAQVTRPSPPPPSEKMSGCVRTGRQGSVRGDSV